ncbi:MULTISPECIES: hypothetical protein [unclassified Thalassospira]|uniref:hypothetical protein n=1 Tax=unclassified Thalassospira TaxID=2648997 RepID=UPI0007A63211|nr:MULTISPECIES: hypothetical protein [unclassified Thalassospira]KZC99937.1 hypothetical protein AUQ41_09795 [Thalassospira sp. MCCC 1A02898]ONH86101.1 hypothetical protein TH47_17905 [Thalassospira sp. MCCC 1A02803]
MDNPFAGLDIAILDDFREKIDTYVQRREGQRASPLNQPFNRNVDIWFFAIMLAVQNGLKPTEVKGKTYKAAEGVVIGSDSWRPTALTLLAIAESEDPNIVDRAGDMMRIANSYANAGFPLLFSMLDSRGDDTALDYLCDEVEKFVR